MGIAQRRAPVLVDEDVGVGAGAGRRQVDGRAAVHVELADRGGIAGRVAAGQDEGHVGAGHDRLRPERHVAAVERDRPIDEDQCALDVHAGEALVAGQRHSVVPTDVQ